MGEKKQREKKMIKKADEAKQKNPVTLQVCEASKTSGSLLWSHVLPINQKNPKNPFPVLVSVSGPTEKSNQLVVFCFSYNDKSAAALHVSKHSTKWQRLQPLNSFSARLHESQNSTHAKDS